MKNTAPRSVAASFDASFPLRVLALLMLAAALILTISLEARAADKTPLTPERAQELLAPMLQGARVTEVHPSPLPGLWELVIAVPGGKKSLAYFNDENMLLVTGSIIDVKGKANLTKDRYDDLNRVDFASIPLDDAKVMGNPKAKHKVIVFDDPD